MAEFTPRDDRDPENGWESMEDNMPDDVHTDRVDVDPDLFGEYPDGPIEVITADGEGAVSAEQVHEWNRQVALVRLTEACPYCDDECERTTSRDTDDRRIVEWYCTNCNEEWVALRDKLP